MGQKRIGPPWQCPIPHPPSWESPALTHMLSLYPLEKSWAEKVSPGMELWHIGGGVAWVKSNCSLYPLQFIQTQSFCSSVVLELLGFHKGPLIHRQLSISVFSSAPRPWLSGAGASSWAPAGSTARTEAYVPITQCPGGQDTCCSPQRMLAGCLSSQKELLPMDRCRIVVGRENTTRAILFCHVADITSLLPNFLDQFLYKT